MSKNILDFSKERIRRQKKKRAAQLHDARNPQAEIDKMYPLHWMSWWVRFDRWLFDNLAVVSFYAWRAWVRAWGPLLFLGFLILSLSIFHRAVALQP